MDSILKNLYYSNFNRDEIIYAKNPDYRKISNQVIEVMNLLKERVTEADFKIITDLMELNDELGSLEVTNAFEYGFKYGTLIMIEVLTDNEIKLLDKYKK